MIELKRSGPIRINEFAWFYRNARSIDVIHELRDGAGKFIRTDTLKIPLAKIVRNHQCAIAQGSEVCNCDIEIEDKIRARAKEVFK